MPFLGNGRRGQAEGRRQYKKQTYRFHSNPTLRNKEFRVIDLRLAAQHQFGTMVVVLANVFEWVDVGSPSHREYLRAPWGRVCAWIIDRRLILQRVHIGPREAFGEF